MVKKLGLVLKRPLLLLSLEALVGVALVQWTNISRSWFVAFLFVCYAWWLYTARAVEGAVPLGVLYAVFIGITICVAFVLPAGFSNAVIFLFFGFLLWVVVAVRRLLFATHARQMLGIFFYFVVFLVSAYASATSPSGAWWATFPFLFLFFFLTVREYVRMVLADHSSRITLFSLVIGLLCAQLLWVLSLLSVGFLNVASLVLVFLIVALDLSGYFFAGTLSRRTLFNSVGFLSFFVLLIVVLPLIFS